MQQRYSREAVEVQRRCSRNAATALKKCFSSSAEPVEVSADSRKIHQNVQQNVITSSGLVDDPDVDAVLGIGNRLHRVGMAPE